MSFDFPAILVLVVGFTGIVSFVDWIYCKCKPIEKSLKKPIIIEYARSFFPVLLIVLIIRSFIAQIYNVPSESLEPTVIPGDLIFVNQFAYGLHLPVWNTRLLSIGEPKRGQIALFYWPVNKKVTFIKRVIGVPGDHISYVNKILYVNGKEAKQTLIGESTDKNTGHPETWQVKIYEENLDGVKHKIFVCSENSINCPAGKTESFYNLVVPQGQYFMMGDNRDDSGDSRAWGMVPEKDLIGKAEFILLSLDPKPTHWCEKIRFNRIGTGL